VKNKQPLFARLSANWPAKILSLAAAVVLFLFNRISTLEERYLSVSLEIMTANDLVPSSAYPTAVRVTLRGEGSSIAAVLQDEIEAYADFTSYEKEGIYRAPIGVRRKGMAANINPLETRTDPTEVMIGLERGTVKSVPVIPSFKGYMEPGYELSEYTLTPSIVEVSGPRSLIDQTADVSTEQIELTGRKEDFSANVGLVREDPLIEIAGNPSAVFMGKVLESIVLKTLENVVIGARNLNKQLAVDGVLSVGSVKIQGNQKDVTEFQPDEFTLSVDCTGIKAPGTYKLSVDAVLPPGLAAVAHSPAEASVVIVQNNPTASREGP
jgi:YbbR domain-containing protein